MEQAASQVVSCLSLGVCKEKHNKDFCPRGETQAQSLPAQAMVVPQAHLEVSLDPAVWPWCIPTLSGPLCPSVTQCGQDVPHGVCVPHTGPGA